MLDATVAGKHKVEVRGGRIKPAKSESAAWVEVGTEPVIVGRNEACDLVLDDGKVSAVHVELVATERGVRVRDLGAPQRHLRRRGARRRGVPPQADQLRIGETRDRLRAGRARAHRGPDGRRRSARWSAQSPSMRGVFERLDQGRARPS